MHGLYNFLAFVLLNVPKVLKNYRYGIHKLLGNLETRVGVNQLTVKINYRVFMLNWGLPYISSRLLSAMHPLTQKIAYPIICGRCGPPAPPGGIPNIPPGLSKYGLGCDK